MHASAEGLHATSTVRLSGYPKVAEAPGQLTGGFLQALWLNGSNGGRGWDRSSDLSDVNRF